MLAAAYYFMNGSIVILTLGAALLHELSHYVALQLCGGKVRKVRITAFGAEMQVENAVALSYWREIFCAAAGPLCNLIFAVCCSFFVRENKAFALWGGIHGAMAFFNLFPFEASDGGWILRAALCGCFGIEAGERVSFAVGGFCAAAVVLLSLWVMLKTGGNGFLLLGSVGLILPARKRYL